ncbi:hypothetical protein ACYF6T_31745 [Streptomyces sp. 7R007]
MRVGGDGASWAVRALRAAVFAVLCVLLAAGGHALAAGAAPPVWAQAAGAAPVFAAGCLLGGRERSLAGIGAGMLGAQGGLHLVFDAVRPHAGMAMDQAYTMHHLHRVHPVTPHAGAAHVGAALVLTWWLRRGEAAVWSLLRRTAALVPGLVAWLRGGRQGVPDTPGLVRGRGGAEPGAGRGVRLRYAVHRRGPPAGTTYA